METIFNGLLDFNKKEELDEFLNSIDKNKAIKLIELGILYAQQNGLYNLTESHCLYICLNKIKNDNNEKL